MRQYLAKRIEEIATGVAKAYRGICEMEMVCAAPVINDPEMAVLAARAAKVVGEGAVVTLLPTPIWGEDFVISLPRKKVLIKFLISSNPEKGTNVPTITQNLMWTKMCFI